MSLLVTVASHVIFS